MEILYIIIGIIIVLYFVNKYFAKGINTITGDSLKLMLKEKSLNRSYIDVRTPSEFKSRKIKGFKNIPLDQLKSRLNQIPQDNTVVVICQSGSRSTAAARTLVKAGYTDVYNVRGGMNLWK